MRTVLVSFLLLCTSLGVSAQAERRMFVVANDADGYGIDRCLASGEKCGAAAANAYCKTQAFAQAAMYHKVESSDMSEAISHDNSTSCYSVGCNVVAIVCTR